MFHIICLTVSWESAELSSGSHMIVKEKFPTMLVGKWDLQVTVKGHTFSKHSTMCEVSFPGVDRQHFVTQQASHFPVFSWQLSLLVAQPWVSGNEVHFKFVGCGLERAFQVFSMEIQAGEVFMCEKDRCCCYRFFWWACGWRRFS